MDRRGADPVRGRVRAEARGGVDTSADHGNAGRVDSEMRTAARGRRSAGAGLARRGPFDGARGLLLTLLLVGALRRGWRCGCSCGGGCRGRCRRRISALSGLPRLLGLGLVGVLFRRLSGCLLARFLPGLACSPVRLGGSFARLRGLGRDRFWRRGGRVAMPARGRGIASGCGRRRVRARLGAGLGSRLSRTLAERLGRARGGPLPGAVRATRIRTRGGPCGGRSRGGG